MAFSSSALLADLDYLAPSQACIKPVMVKSTASDGTVGIHRHGGELQPNEEIVKISLQDCLACSGCVTSAETMLVEKQSKDEILNVLGASPEKPVAVSVSDQSAASIAVQLGVGIPDAMRIISGFAREVLRARVVVDLRWANRVSVFETAVEFLDRLQNRPEALPLIVSSCPGWVCYCEKSHPALIPLLCRVKSAQAIAAEYLKGRLAPAGVSSTASHSFHISVQMCFDKKLEAVREDFTEGGMEDGHRFTDFVVSTAELLQWMREVDDSPAKRWDAPLDSTPDACRAPCSASCEAAHLEGSGGFHQFAVEYASGALLGRPTPREELQYRSRRNPNHRTIPFTLPDGTEKEVCVAYGFQHIQNIVRGLNRKLNTVAKYCFIELMACPDGCLNGGGQVRTTRHNETLSAVNTVFEAHAADLAARGDSPPTPPHASPGPVKAMRHEGDETPATSGGIGANAFATFDAVYQQWLGAPPGSAAAHERLSTGFHDRKALMDELLKESQVAQTLKW